MKKYRPRTYYTEADKTMMWDRWAQGESLHSIARLFDRHHPSIRRILAQTGGIRPPIRRRSPLALSLAEREECVFACRIAPLLHQKLTRQLNSNSLNI